MHIIFLFFFSHHFSQSKQLRGSLFTPFLTLSHQIPELERAVKREGCNILLGSNSCVCSSRYNANLNPSTLLRQICRSDKCMKTLFLYTFLGFCRLVLTLITKSCMHDMRIRGMLLSSGLYRLAANLIEMSGPCC